MERPFPESRSAERSRALPPPPSRGSPRARGEGSRGARAFRRWERARSRSAPERERDGPATEIRRVGVEGRPAPPSLGSEIRNDRGVVGADGRNETVAVENVAKRVAESDRSGLRRYGGARDASGLDFSRNLLGEAAQRRSRVHLSLREAEPDQAAVDAAVRPEPGDDLLTDVTALGRRDRVREADLVWQVRRVHVDPELRPPRLDPEDLRGFFRILLRTGFPEDCFDLGAHGDWGKELRREFAFSREKHGVSRNADGGGSRSIQRDLEKLFRSVLDRDAASERVFAKVFEDRIPKRRGKDEKDPIGLSDGACHEKELALRSQPRGGSRLAGRETFHLLSQLALQKGDSILPGDLEKRGRPQTMREPLPRRDIAGKTRYSGGGHRLELPKVATSVRSSRAAALSARRRCRASSSASRRGCRRPSPQARRSLRDRSP